MKLQEMDKKVMFVIHPHSIVDVITNSSTELFVIDTDKSMETIKDILQEAINLHNKAEGTSYTFEDIFEEPRFNEGKVIIDGWENYYQSKHSDAIIIEGASDNSIPYWMFEFIEYVFGYSTERFHLG